MCLRCSSRRHKMAPIDYRLTWYTTFRSAILTLRYRHAKPSEVIKKEFPIKIQHTVLNGNSSFNTTKINNRTRKTYKHARDLHLLYLDPRRIYCSREPINGICRVLFGGSEAFNKQRGVKIKRVFRCCWINRCLFPFK